MRAPWTQTDPADPLRASLAALAEAVNHAVYWTCVRAAVAVCLGDGVDVVAHAWWWAVRFPGPMGCPTLGVGDQVGIICSGHRARARTC